MNESPFKDTDDFSYARDHDRGPGKWCVVGPKDFHVFCDDKSMAAILGLLLSGNVAAAAEWAKEIADAVRHGDEGWYRST